MAAAAAGKAAGKRAADVDLAAADAPALKPTRKFEWTEDAKSYIDELNSDASEKPRKGDEDKFKQLTKQAQSAIINDTVRALVFHATAGQGKFNPATIATHVMENGSYNGVALSGSFLIGKARQPLLEKFGFCVSDTRETLTVADSNMGAYDEVLKTSSTVQLHYHEEGMDDIDSDHLKALLPRPAAVRGVLFAVLGMIMCERDKCIKKDALEARLAALGVQIGKKTAEEEGDDRDDDLPPWESMLREFKNNDFVLITKEKEVDADGHSTGVAHEVFRIGAKARSLIGIPNILAVVCGVAGVPYPTGEKYISNLGPESAGIQKPEKPKGKGKAKPKKGAE